MIKSITVINHLNETIKIDLFNPYESGLAVKSVTGLGPVKADINFKNLSTMDGALDSGFSRITTRNIVIQFVFIESPTIEETRLKTYKYFSVKQNITIRIETDVRTYEIVGRVESNNPTIFSKEEGSQVSIMCANPFFYSLYKQNISFYGVKSLFEFPFSNESLDNNLIIFGDIQKRVYSTIYYDGDSNAGIIIKMHAIGEVRGITIYNLLTREKMALNDNKIIEIAETGIQNGDDIIIDTIKGEKSVTLIRDGIEINILNSIEKPMKWLQLVKGYNAFAYTTTSGSSNLSFNMEYKTLYEGV